MIDPIRDAATLLGRVDRAPALSDTAAALQGARILVTGAGGSIGAHLSGALARVGAASLTLVDHHEHSLFDLVRALDGAPSPVQFVLADVRDRPKMRRVFEAQRPTHVFHLAAYKHVPFGQLFPEETVSVNVVATRMLLDLSTELGVEHFVYPSSDKAVNPPSLYGATKRISEVATQQCAQATERAFTIVRYVNVIGTRGSVIETFGRQLAAEASLTVTSAEMTRYWMTMNEAVWLLVTAATNAHPGDILMLADLEEVSVVEMAGRIGELLGKPNPPIRFTGIRPGERLREELISANECWELGPVPGMARVGHRNRAGQLAVPLPPYADRLEDPAATLTEAVMGLARLLQ